jgi:NADPH:quinone reductase
VLEQHSLAPPPGFAVVEVAAAGVNPSDVKATLGIMPKAVFPRTPGRDFAGTVVAGPAQWLGRQVWGSGGDLGITRDGSHARHLALPVEALFEKPANLSLLQAAAIGVPFVTAAVGFAEAGGVRPGSTVVVHGANGRVGQAACQIALAAGARVVGVTRREEARPAVPAGVEVVVGLAGAVGADLVFNTIGSAVFADANAAMGHGATQIFIATQSRAVDFDILAFYRGRHRFVGVDTLALSAALRGKMQAGSSE